MAHNPDAFNRDDPGKQMRDILARLEALESERRLEAASIGAGGITVKGGLIRALGATDQKPIFIVGEWPQGSEFPGERAFGVFRDDGTLALSVAGNPADQTLQIFDQAWQEIFADDAASGHGLARPYLAMPLYASFDAELSGGLMWPSTTVTASGTVLLHGQGACWHPKFSVAMFTSSDGGSTNWRVMIDGVQAGDTQSGTAATAVDVPGWGDTIVPGQVITLEIEAWRSGGGTRVWIQPTRCEGRQS